MMRTAILASQNKNKIVELKAILEKYGLEVISRDDAGLPRDDIEENGTTFEENSYIKARAIMDMIHSDESFAMYNDSPVIADDSGLMVDALGGRPGVYSARYAGDNYTYDDNNNKLLAELGDLPMDKRGAQFVTVITLLYPSKSEAPSCAKLDEAGNHILTARGELYGHIAMEKRGSEGFGFDPLFVPQLEEENDKTFAELGNAFKNRISHRAKALDELERLLSI